MFTFSSHLLPRLLFLRRLTLIFISHHIASQFTDTRGDRCLWMQELMMEVHNVCNYIIHITCEYIFFIMIVIIISLDYKLQLMI